jgi:shikimate dehydrogenase
MPPSDDNNSLDIFPVAGVLGHGIAYTLSPLLNSAADAASGRGLDYQTFDVAPEHLDSFLSRIVKFSDLIGFNVTTPHKEAIANRLDAMHESAREVGAVNTVALRGEHLIGYNTDRPAIASVLKAELKASELPPAGWTVVMLGAGGAARAAIWALLDLDIADNIIMSARNADRLHSVANDVYIACSRAGVTFTRHPWLDWTTLFVNPPAMLINATPLGTAATDGREGSPSPVPPLDHLRQFEMVFDLVYNPPITGLMAAANKIGCHAVGGGGTLIEQAIQSRSIWLGSGKEDVERMAMVAAYTSWANKISKESSGRT